LVETGIVFGAEVSGEWIAKRADVTSYDPAKSMAIARVIRGEIVGGVLFTDFNGANLMMHVAGEGNWLNRQMLKVCFDFPFVRLKAKRVTGIVLASNEAARRFDEHLGFKLEAVLKEAHPEGDLLLYCMRADECRWLRKLPNEQLPSS
jgi:RimJ/RimL family protein N-acetyltransferase